MTEPPKKKLYAQFLQEKLNARKMRVADLKRATGVTHSYIGDILKSRTYPATTDEHVTYMLPSVRFVELFTKALNVNPADFEIELATHLVAAGHAPHIPCSIEWDQEGNLIVRRIDSPHWKHNDPQEEVLHLLYQMDQKLDAALRYQEIKAKIDKLLQIEKSLDETS